MSMMPMQRNFPPHASSFCPKKDVNANLPVFLKQRREEILKAFTLFDRDGDGRIDLREFKSACLALGVQTNDYTNETLTRVFGTKREEDEEEEEEEGGNARENKGSKESALVSSSSFYFTFENFQKFLIDAWPYREPNSIEEVQEIFSLFDRKQKGYVTLEDLKEAAEAVRSRLSVEDLALMVREGDLDGDGKLSLQDFHRIFKKVFFKEEERERGSSDRFLSLSERHPNTARLGLEEEEDEGGGGGGGGSEARGKSFFSASTVNSSSSSFAAKGEELRRQKKTFEIFTDVDEEDDF